MAADLEGPGPDARRRRTVAAGHLGDEGTARAGLHDPEGSVRAAALGALERLRRLTEVELAAAAEDSDPTVRRRAAELAAAHPGVDLRSLLADADPLVVEAACWASGERERTDPAALDPLLEVAVGHDDPLCREAAVAALGALGDERGLPAILAATRDRPAVRRRAVLALAPFEGDEVDQALRRALEDRDLQVRQAAEDLLDDP